MIRLVLAIASMLFCCDVVAVAGPSETVVQRIKDRATAAYIGGMDAEARAISLAARAVMSLRYGPDLPHCETENIYPVLQQVRRAEFEQPNDEASALLNLLAELLRHERPVVRDSAAYVIAEIGPAAVTLATNLEADDWSESAWVEYAWDRVNCEEPSFGLEAKSLPATLGGALTKNPPGIDERVAHLEEVAKLVKIPGLRWPGGFFADWVGYWTDASQPRLAAADINEAVVRSSSSIATIAAVAADQQTDPSLRLDLIRMLGRLKALATNAEPILAELAGTVDSEVSRMAANALIEMGSERAGVGYEAILTREQALTLNFSLFRSICDWKTGSVSPVLHGLLIDRLDTRYSWSDARQVVDVLGCLPGPRTEAALRSALQHPSWEIQRGVAIQLGALQPLQAVTIRALEALATEHWSVVVRGFAAQALDAGAGTVGIEKHTLSKSILNCGRYCPVDHGLSRCGSDTDLVDGLYSSPSLGEFQVQWQRARRHPRPAGFPVEVPAGSLTDRGTSGYLKVEGGWLYGIDNWGWGGGLGFVSSDGKQQQIGDWGEYGAGVIATPHFGPVALGGMSFHDGGSLAQFVEGAEGWSIRHTLGLPNRPWGWAFAPDGTLLVADPYNAVAIHKDLRIEPLSCPAAAAENLSDLTLLGLAAQSNDAPMPARYASAEQEILRQTQLLGTFSEAYQDAAMLSAEHAAEERLNLLKNYLELVDDLALIYLLSSRADEGHALLADVRRAHPQWASNSWIFLAASVSDVPALETTIRDVGSARAGESDAQVLIMAAHVGGDFERSVALARQGEIPWANHVLVGSGAASGRAYRELLVGLSTGSFDSSLPAPALQDPSSWPTPILAHLRDEIDESGLARFCLRRDGSIDREKLAEALYFTGVRARQLGNDALAERHYAEFLALGMVDLMEHTAILISSLNLPSLRDH